MSNLDLNLIFEKALLRLMGIEGFNPKIENSIIWVKWVTVPGPGTCIRCLSENGRIYDKWEIQEYLPVHDHCKCRPETLKAIKSGTATIDGLEGADYTMKNYHILPANYVKKSEARLQGWLPEKGNLKNVLPDATIGGDIYRNKELLLPDAPGRIWYEADINYIGGYRNNGSRILYSNDGLVFATYDHYRTFYEII